MNAEVAKAIVEFYASSMENEAKTTAKVLAAVPESGHGYKPDPKSRSAWELATHIAASDVAFLDAIIAGDFSGLGATEEGAVSQFKTSKDVVDFYSREYPGTTPEAEGAAGGEADPGGRFLRSHAGAEHHLPRNREQPRYPSSRATRGVLAGDGFEGAGNLWTEC